MNFIASLFQKAIQDWLRTGKGNALVEAVPGSGKTTTLVWLLTDSVTRALLWNKKVLLTSFDSKTVRTLGEKITSIVGALPTSWTIGTLHKFGRSAVKDYLASRGVRRIKLHGARGFNGKEVPDKSMCIIWELFPKVSDKRPPEYFFYFSFVKKLVGLAKNEGIGTPLVEDTMQAWESLVAKHGLFLSNPKANEARGIEIARDVLHTSNLWSEQGKIDFDDMLYLVALWDLPLPKQDFILGDEWQDTNRIQLDLIRRMCGEDTRCLFVGDSRQSVYGFRGADAQAMNKACEMFACKKLPLSICYRCSVAVVKAMNEVLARWYARCAGKEYKVQDFNFSTDPRFVQAFAQAEQGKVQALESYSLDIFGKDDAVLCRNVAPLVALAYQFIRNSIPVHILGRSIGDDLLGLIDRMGAGNVDDLEEKLNDYQTREIDKLLDKNREAEADALRDRCDCVRIFIDTLSEANRTLDTLKANIAKLFTDSNGNSLTLATCHKSKGLEWVKVYLLDKHLMPSKYATQDWQLEQETNLEFVAKSRAKLEMYYIESQGLDRVCDDSLGKASEVSKADLEND
jgi:DNA helicase-2/ATP-dependent DNA helicase PcrA